MSRDVYKEVYNYMVSKVHVVRRSQVSDATKPVFTQDELVRFCDDLSNLITAELFREDVESLASPSAREQSTGGKG